MSGGRTQKRESSCPRAALARSTRYRGRREWRGRLDPTKGAVHVSEFKTSSNRRLFLGSVAFGLGSALFAPGAFAEQLSRTPSMTEGPFYPNKLPLDTDNDLIIVNDSLTPAVGEITHLGGRILGPNGSPIKNA